MKKYAIPGAMLLIGHEVTSLLALSIAMIMFFADMFNETKERF